MNTKEDRTAAVRRMPVHCEPLRAALVTAAVLGTLSSSGGLATHPTQGDTRVALITGRGATASLKGTAVLVTHPNGEHEVFVRVTGLPAGGPFHMHIHANSGKDITCASDDTNRVTPLTSLERDSAGSAVSYTKLHSLVTMPTRRGFVQVHSLDGKAIACGDLEIVKLGKR